MKQMFQRHGRLKVAICFASMSTRIGALIEFRVSQRKMKCGRSLLLSALHRRQEGLILFWLKVDLVDWNLSVTSA